MSYLTADQLGLLSEQRYRELEGHRLDLYRVADRYIDNLVDEGREGGYISEAVMLPTVDESVEALRDLTREDPRPGGVRNTYEHQFIVACPGNGIPVLYTLTLRTSGRVVSVETITAATRGLTAIYHEALADHLYEALGGGQTLAAFHHGVQITTRRGSVC